LPGFRHRFGALVALVMVLIAAPAAAAADCPPASDLDRPFLRFLDPAQYYLAPGGDFERGAWAGGAAVTGNEPFHVTSGGTRSLSIASPSAATSPPICIGIDHPTIRFFAKRTGGPAIAALGVDVVFTDLLGIERRVALVPVLSPVTGAWVLTLPTPILANVVALPGPTAEVRFIFTPAAGSTWRIDDVHIDPYQRN
jgi:hypothetical protein